MAARKGLRGGGVVGSFSTVVRGSQNARSLRATLFALPVPDKEDFTLPELAKEGLKLRLIDIVYENKLILISGTNGISINRL